VRRAAPHIVLIAALAGACLILAACGSSTPKDEVHKTVETYINSFREGNTQQACDLIAPPARARMSRLFKSDNCPALLSKTYRRLGASIDTLANAELDVLSVDATNARARIALAGRREDARMQKVGDRWTIDRVDLVASLFGLND
jgi:hypothetical protein